MAGGDQGNTDGMFTVISYYYLIAIRLVLPYKWLGSPGHQSCAALKGWLLKVWY